MKLHNRTVLITGGTSGIGLELARRLLARNNSVIVTGRDRERLDRVAQMLPGIVTMVCDVADPAAIAALHGEMLARFPTLDVVVNNAGIMRTVALVEDRGLDDLTREIAVNLDGPMRMVQAFLPDLRARTEALIVNVTSGLAFVPLPVSPVYCAAKTGLHVYTQCLRVQLRGTSVAVVELAPPGVDTPLFHGVSGPAAGGPKPMPVAVLARRAIAGIEAGRTEIRPGLSNVLKAMGRIAPGFMLNQMHKMTTAD